MDITRRKRGEGGEEDQRCHNLRRAGRSFDAHVNELLAKDKAEYLIFDKENSA